MLNKVLLTPIDDIVEYVKTHNNCSISEIKNEIKQPLDIIEKWLTVLEEYSIIRVKYKGFEGYVEFIETDSKKQDIDIDVDQIKEVFVKKCKLKQLSYERMERLWPVFIDEHKDEMKEMFVRKAKRMGYEKMKIEKAWLKYENEMRRL